MIAQVRPEEFLDVARALGAADEAQGRSAVSRIYYGVHHLAIEAYHLQAPPRARHTWLIEQLRSLNPTISGHVAALKARRELADYDLADPWLTVYVSEAWATAERIRRRLPSP